MMINENRTPEQALRYFQDGRTQFYNRVDPLMSEVYSNALEWKKKNVSKEDWNKYSLKDICESMILGQL